MNKYNLENLELMSYQDIAKEILKVEEKSMNTFDVFTIISKLLNFTEAQFEKRIEDFFATLSTDKNFILLEDGTWDLKKNHVSKKIIEEDEDEDVEDITEETDETDEEENDDLNFDQPNHDDDSIISDDDDLSQLTILTEDEIDEN